MQELNRQWNARRFFLLTIVLIASAFTAIAQRRERTVDSWRPLHYDVNLSFDDQVTQITSARTDVSIEVIARNLATIDFDFGDMPIDSVLVNGATSRFDRTPETLNVALPHGATRGEKLTVTINYHGHPKDGLVF